MSVRGRILRLTSLVIVFVVVHLGLAGCRPESDGIHRVSTQAELQSALRSASPGDVIILADGHYGVLDQTLDFDKVVVIRAQNVHGAVLESVRLVRSQGVSLQGLRIMNSVDISGKSAHITLRNNKIVSTVIVRAAGSHHIVIDGNDIDGGVHGLILDSVADFEITNNYIHDAQSDLVRVTGDSPRGLIEDNILQDVQPVPGMHPDGIQMFSYNGASPRDIVIRGNYLYDDPNTGEPGLYMQGIFLGQDVNEGILVEQNLLSIGSPNSIAWNNGLNMTVRNNTLLSWTVGGGGAGLRPNGPQVNTIVEGNVFLSRLDHSDGTIDWSGNVQYSNNPGDPLFWGKLFQTAEGQTWKGFLPKEGSVIDFGSPYGAQVRLGELNMN